MDGFKIDRESKLFNNNHMLNNLIKFLLIFCVGILVSCAKRNPEPIASLDFIKSAEEDLIKIEKIKEENDLFNKDLQIDLYTAIALAIENNKDLKVKLLETSLADKKLKDLENQLMMQLLIEDLNKLIDIKIMS